mmetsp:Transcript_20775/g.43512  ORF Transcript_20775/g.43512 Transcript_20775/m.43512 type:complete len:109 (-) Transcript_20775:881-1207(-)
MKTPPQIFGSRLGAMCDLSCTPRCYKYRKESFKNYSSIHDGKLLSYYAVNGYSPPTTNKTQGVTKTLTTQPTSHGAVELTNIEIQQQTWYMPLFQVHTDGSAPLRSLM